MDKLLNVLAELNINDDYIAPEIREMEDWLDKASESVNAYQTIGDENELKAKDIKRLKDEQISLQNEIREREKEYLMNIQKLQDLKWEHECLLRSDDAAKNEILANVEREMKLFGIDIEAQYLESTVYQAKISFGEDKFVIFNCDIIRNTYDLQAIEPKHSRWEDMRSFLLESRDIVGFMCHVRQFFARKTRL